MPSATKALVLATSNAGKIQELSKQLAGTGWSVTPQSEYGVVDVKETGLSFIENAILKARHAAMCTGLPAVADDSGLAVDALGGAPGIYSARYAGDSASDSANVQKLLASMEGRSERGAWFYCVLAFVVHADDPVPLIAQGRWSGSIATKEAGGGGFGYDPIFIPAGLSCSAAEMKSDEKRARSHRAQALELFIPELKNNLVRLL